LHTLGIVRRRWKIVYNYSAAVSLDGYPWALLASLSLFFVDAMHACFGTPDHMNLRKLSLAAVVAALLLSACAGAPVQEMSDARQAVAVAEQTLAGKPDSADLVSARQYLQAAQVALDAGDYSTARTDAQLARQLALRALGISQTPDGSGRSPR
jgi:hypothetical protein